MICPVSIAPMMDYTDRHYRRLMRFITQHTLLYTEMIPCQMLVRGQRWDVLDFSPAEHPLALQLGGSDPAELALCAKRGEDLGYQEINLNVGCPSDRVQAGRFGACLMKEPNLVAECVAAMRKKISVPVTVKTRLGVDERDSYTELCQFIEKVKQADCDTFIIHARKAWLKGLSPRENREIPPLRYEWVYQLKRDFPSLNIVINGGIKTLEDIEDHLQHVEGVMIGREAYANSYLFAEIDRRFFGANRDPAPRQQILRDFYNYAKEYFKGDAPLRLATRHLQGLFHGQPGARRWRSGVCGSNLQISETLEVLLEEIV